MVCKILNGNKTKARMTIWKVFIIKKTTTIFDI